MKNQRANPDYEHNPEGDASTDLPEDLKYLEDQGIKAVKYGTHVLLRGTGYSTQIIDEFLRKINNKESLVIAVTGGPGTGKTYFGMQLACILDPDFNITDTPAPPPTEDNGQITFDRSHIMYLTGPDSPLKRGQAIVPDETHFGVGSRSWGNKEQQALTNYIAAIRSKGLILILIVLHTTMLDKMIRDYVINYEIHMTRRGEGMVYRRWFPQFGKEIFKKKLGKLCLTMPDSELCNYPSCLGCRNLDPKDDSRRCDTLRAIYERRKNEFLNEKGKQAEEENKENTYHTFDEILEKILPIKDTIPRHTNGKIKKGECATWLKDNGCSFKSRDQQAVVSFIILTLG